MSLGHATRCFKELQSSQKCSGKRQSRLSEIKKRHQQSGSFSSPPEHQLIAGPVHYGEFVAWLAAFSAALSMATLINTLLILRKG